MRLMTATVEANSRKRNLATTHPADTCRPCRGEGWRRRENLSQLLGGVITYAA